MNGATLSIKAAILDLDGTLLDTLDDLADSMNEALASLGYPTHPVDEYRFFVGDGIHVLVARTLPEQDRNEASIARAVDVYRATYERNWRSKSRPYDGMLEALEQLRAGGIKLTVLSNKPQHFTELCVNHFFPPGVFDVVFGQRSHVPRKPDPAGAVEIANLLGLKPDEIAFVGDTMTDMHTGSAAGMRCIGVAWGFRPVAELLEHGAQDIVQQPVDLANLLLG